MQTIKTTWMANIEVKRKKKNTNYFEGKRTSQDKNAYEKSEFLTSCVCPKSTWRHPH